MVLFNRTCQKSMTGFSHAPLETAFSLHRGNTVWPPPQLLQLPVIIASNFTCSKVILSGDFYRGNAIDPPARVKPPWDTKILSFPLESTPHRLGGGGVEKPPELYCSWLAASYGRSCTRSPGMSIIRVDSGELPLCNPSLSAASMSSLVSQAYAFHQPVGQRLLCCWDIEEHKLASVCRHMDFPLDTYLRGHNVSVDPYLWEHITYVVISVVV